MDAANIIAPEVLRDKAVQRPLVHDARQPRRRGQSVMASAADGIYAAALTEWTLRSMTNSDRRRIFNCS